MGNICGQPNNVVASTNVQKNTQQKVQRQSVNSMGKISKEQQEETLEEHETKLSDFFKTQR